jgi:hypothetical protein
MFKDTKRNQWWLSFSGGPFAGPNADYQIAATPCAGPAGPCLEQGIFLDKNGTIWISYGPWAPFFLGKPRPLTLVKIGFYSNGLLYVSTP